MNELVAFAVEHFEDRFGLSGLRGEVSFALPGEALVTLFVPGEPTAAMQEAAREMEREYDELGRTVRMVLKSAGS
ncbi:hypothetical protein [Thiocapsa marina]|uniref:Uncharacterized protein n=1 Tax=Thiocapsa marina 5811 TaxID=768671 RepID=F9U685_9GAMM|nr:hypothetical protein [Thiocapsa marina]EGV20658.1 hypothetical protein ThimaDRAFT_0436 [Thiocapsa marina 5811]